MQYHRKLFYLSNLMIIISVFITGCQSYEEPLYHDQIHYHGVIKVSDQQNPIRLNYDLYALDQKNYQLNLSFLTYSYKIIQTKEKIRVFEGRRELRVEELLKDFEEKFSFQSPEEFISLILFPEQKPKGWVLKTKKDKLLIKSPDLKISITRNRM